MNLSNIALNFYSFGFSGGLMNGIKRKKPVLGIDDLVKIVEKYGLGGIEIPLDRFYLVNEIDEAVKKIKQIQSQNLSVFIDLENTNVEYITRLIPYLPSLGIKVIRIKMDQIGKTIYGGNRYLSETFADSIDSFKKQLSLILPFLEEYKVSLAIENHQDFHSFELIDICKSISEEYIGLTWDVGNSISVLQSPENFYNTANHAIKNVHLKDYKVYKSDLGISLERCPLGEGYVDYIDVMRKLKNQGINNMSIELGAQSARLCNINKKEYWDEFLDIPIEKESYLDFINQIVVDYDPSLLKNKLIMSEDEMIKNELQDVEKSVNNLKKILEIIL